MKKTIWAIIAISFLFLSRGEAQELKHPLTDKDRDEIRESIDFPTLSLQLNITISPNMLKQKLSQSTPSDEEIAALEQKLASADETAALKIHYDLAELYARKNNTELAQKHYKDAYGLVSTLIKSRPTDGELYLYRGRVTQQLNPEIPTADLMASYRNSINDLVRAVQLLPDSAEAWYELSSARLAILDTADGLYAAEKAVTMQPDNTDYVVTLFMLHFFSGMRSFIAEAGSERKFTSEEIETLIRQSFYLEGLDKYYTVLKDNPDFLYFYHTYRLATKMFFIVLRTSQAEPDNPLPINPAYFSPADRKELTEIKDYLDKTARSDLPNKAPVFQALGFYHYITGGKNQAVLNFRRAISANPQDPQPYENIATIYLGDKNLAKFREAIQTKVENVPQAKDYLILAKFAFNDKNYGEATRYCLQAREKEPQNPSSLLALAVVYIRQGGISKASDFLEQAEKIQSENADLWYYKGVIQMLKNLPIQAAADFNEALSFNDSHEKTLDILEKYFNQSN